MKFIYLTDTHIGGSDTQGYRQQERYLRYQGELFRTLGEWLSEHPEVAFILHGGDMADAGTAENIHLARELFGSLPRSCFLSLGNHDLTENDSAANWLRLAPEFFPEKQADYYFLVEDIRFDVLTVHWGKKTYFWNPDEAQIPWLSDDQLDRLQRGPSGRHRVLITHAPPCGLPEGQTGLAAPLHPPAGNFSSRLQQLARELPLDLILGAHNHMNLAVKAESAVMATSAAFTETPFDFKVIEITADQLSVNTMDLVNRVPFRTFYDHRKGFVQGRPCDRMIAIKLPQ